jgi:Mrp family chromosome partitioning ATPase
VREAQGASKVQPRPTRNAILGLFLGLVLGVGLAFLREALDTKVRTSDEIARRLDLPILARIPAPPRQLRSTNKLAMLADPEGVHAEPFRVLRTNVEFANLEVNAKTMMVTSAVEDEGKSTTAANLAVAFARSGKRTILVDLDLRRPFLNKFFPLGRRPGLTDVALRHVSLDEALAPYPLTDGPSWSLRNRTSGNGTVTIAGKLEVIGTGPLPPNPGEFLGSHVVDEILAELAGRADLVLIDAAPLLSVGDALALSAKVEALLLVARIDRMRRPIVRELQRTLEASPAKPLGLIVTAADADETYGYGYSYKGRYAGYARRPEEREGAEAIGLR